MVSFQKCWLGNLEAWLVENIFLHSSFVQRIIFLSSIYFLLSLDSICIQIDFFNGIAILKSGFDDWYHSYLALDIALIWSLLSICLCCLLSWPWLLTSFRVFNYQSCLQTRNWCSYAFISIFSFHLVFVWIFKYLHT